MMAQESESRRSMQLMYADMDKDHSKGISLQEFVSFYTTARVEEEEVQMLAIEDGVQDDCSH
jgi:hypothetical protein